MAKGFSWKLAISNIRNNRKFYLPYFLASVGVIAMFYIMSFIGINEETEAMSLSLAMIMKFGVVVIGIFAVIFLFYINSFLMKRRKKEIGLYNILGMEKKHIGRILIIENGMVSIGAIIVGLLCGMLFSKLIYTIIFWVFDVDPPIGYSVSVLGLLLTVIVFGGIFVLTMISNQMSIRLSKPIELLKGGETGEREPKTKWLLTIVGILCLGIGYFLAITTESPLQAIFIFFVAVVLVIIGTYCLFTSVSIFILKRLKNRKSFYYKPANFTAVSGMMYRMKQNAIGLANICILSTMVLVMISGTVSLYFGMNDVINQQYEGDLTVDVVSWNEAKLDSETREDIKEIMQESCINQGAEVEKYYDYQTLMFTVIRVGGDHLGAERPAIEEEMPSGVAQISVMTAEEYMQISGEKTDLAADEVLFYAFGKDIDDEFTLNDMKFRKVGEVADSVSARMPVYITDTYVMVVADDTVFDQIYQLQADIYGDKESGVSTTFVMDIDGTGEQELACANEVRNRVYELDFEYFSSNVRSAEDGTADYKGMIGGFLFLGIFLGIVFTFAAALIIYYKQISEGYYDKDKFEIMQKVGMSKAEVKKTIRKQVLMVFFAPLLIAGLHVAAAFKLISRLLLVFGMTNIQLFAMCTVITFLVFAAIYLVVYLVTAREYYKIVG